MSLADRVCLVLRLSGLPFLIREVLQRRRVTILFYHRPAADVFAEHANALRSAYNLISLEAFLAALESGRLGELPPKSLIITFDDGHRSNYDLIETLRALPAPPTVFVCSGLVGTEQPFWFDVVADPEALKLIPDEERLLRVQADLRSSEPTGRAALAGTEIDQLKRFVDFQSHTVSHPILPRCPPLKALRELADSRKQLEQRHGLRVYALAYPNGDYTEREIRFARQVGYRCAVTVDFGFNGSSADPFRLRRIAINDDRDGANVVMLKACGLWGALRTVWLAARRAGGRPA